MRQIKKQREHKKRPYIYITIGVILIGAIFFLSPYGRAVIQAVKEMGCIVNERAYLVLDQVTVEGHIQTTKEKIIEVAGLEQKMPMIQVDLDEIQQKIKELPWIKEVVVERHLPRILIIRVTEKTPIAMWQNHKKYYPLDEEGKPIPDPTTVVGGVLLVVGDDAPEYTPALIEVLEKYPEIQEKVRSAVRVGNRRWNLILNDVENGITVKLPESGIEEALLKLQTASEQNKILKKNLDMIDLRGDKLIVRLKEGGKK